MRNLLEETINVLLKNRRDFIDVTWCSLGDEYFTWDDFVELANFSYDSGFGCQEIDPNLVVVGADFWLERHEYDGSEWWEFKSLPIRPEEYKKPKKLKAF